MLRLGIIGSRRGSGMVALQTAIEQKRLTADIVVVISDKSDAMILQRAQQYHLLTQFVDPRLFSTDVYHNTLSTMLHQHQVDLIVLAGYMRILSADFVSEWQNKIINVHPSLLPLFAGKIDQAVHAGVLESGVAETGCSVHYVTAEVDAGPIILQKKCAVLPGDTVESIKNRVQKLEAEALITAIQLIEEKSCAH